MDAAEQHRTYAPGHLGFAVLTASDSRTAADDLGGDLISRAVVAAGHVVVVRQVLADEVEILRSTTISLIENSEIDVIVLTGGTGFSPRDVSVEAISPLLERTIDGFGELFRMLSHRQVGAAAMLSRACGGVSGDTPVFLLPGSTKAVQLAMEQLILPEVGHLIGQLRRSREAS